MVILNEEKYKNAILYMAQCMGSRCVRGKKKFYKLFYYLDFDYFEKYEKPLTGDVYHKKQMGPVPHYFDAIAEVMQREGLLEISKEKTSPTYNDTVIYKALIDPELKIFSDNEINMMKRVMKKYGGKSGTQLEQLTHKEAPYIAVEEGEEMPFELAHYRGTDFKDL